MADDWSEDIPLELIVGQLGSGFIQITSSVPAELKTFYAAHWSTVQLEAVVQFFVTGVAGTEYYYLVAGLNPSTGFPLFATGWVDSSLVVHEGYIAELFSGVLQTIYGNVTANEIFIGAAGALLFADNAGNQRISASGSNMAFRDANSIVRTQFDTVPANSLLAFWDQFGQSRISFMLAGQDVFRILYPAGALGTSIDAGTVKLNDSGAVTRVSLSPSVVAFDVTTDFTQGGVHQGKGVWDRGKTTSNVGPITGGTFGQIIQSDFQRTWINGRAYQVNITQRGAVTVAAKRISVGINQGSNSNVLMAPVAIYNSPIANQQYVVTTSWVFVNTSGANITDFLSIQGGTPDTSVNANFTGTANSPLWFTAEDIGPASDYSWALSMV